MEICRCEDDGAFYVGLLSPQLPFESPELPDPPPDGFINILLVIITYNINGSLKRDARAIQAESHLDAVPFMAPPFPEVLLQISDHTSESNFSRISSRGRSFIA